ncbi:hypothetical protein CCH79_00019209, partial [Gambusia affinis]
MTSVVVDEPGEEPAVWVALRRLDQPGQYFSFLLREMRTRCHGDPSCEFYKLSPQILRDAFGLNVPNVVLKVHEESQRLPDPPERLHSCQQQTHVCSMTTANSHRAQSDGCFCPQAPFHPKPRTIPVTVISRSMKTRLQAVDRRIQRLDELLPQIKLRRHEKLQQVGSTSRCCRCPTCSSTVLFPFPGDRMSQPEAELPSQEAAGGRIPPLERSLDQSASVVTD